jgi:hypothetical protein
MRKRIRCGLLLSALSILGPLVAAAQDRPFAFVSSPAAWDRNGALVFFEPAFADSAPEAMVRDGFGSRVGLEAKVARRVLLVGDIGFADSQTGSLTTFSAEALVDLRPGVVGSGFHLAAGTGYRREAEGASVAYVF